MRLIKPGLMSNSDSTGYWTQSLLLNPTKCMPLFSVNQPSLQIYFLHTNSYLSIMFGIHDPSKCLLMSRPQKAGIFSLKFNRNTHFSTKLQKMHHLEHKSSGKWLPWKTEFLHILIGIKKSFNSSVFLMYFRHPLTFPPSPFHTETVETRGREKFKTEPLQSLFFDVKVPCDNKLDKHETQEMVFHL